MNPALNQSGDRHAIETVLLHGDLSKLSPEQRIAYNHQVCEALGLNPLTQPLAYITLNGKLVLYCKRDGTDQLRKLHRVSVKIVGREKLGDVYVVTAQASTPDGRVDESVGAVSINNLKGDTLANALMKAETKAKRRVTLSICGLGMLDESELETIRNMKPVAEEEVVVENSDSKTAPLALIADEDKAGVPIAATEYQIPFGKFRGLALDEIPRDQLASYCDYLERKANEQHRELRGTAKEFLARALAHLDASPTQH